MATESGIRTSGVSRLGLLALIILAYLIYTVGKLLEVGLDRLLIDFPVVEIGGATAGLIVGLLFVRWFFETAPSATDGLESLIAPFICPGP